MHLFKRIRLPLRGHRNPFSYIDPFIKFDKDDIVLEIGVGDGYAAWTNSDRIKTIYGTDISEPLIDFLEEKNTEPNVHFKSLDITDTDGTNIEQFQNFFDKIFSIDTLLHVADSTAFFKSTYKLLKPGGEAYIVFPNLLGYGITHFESKQILIEQIVESGLKLQTLKEIMESSWLRFLKKTFISAMLSISKKIVGEKHNNSHVSSVVFANDSNKIYYQSQQFDGTHAFEIIKSDPWYRILSNIYFECFWLIAGLRTLYHYSKPKDFQSTLKARQAQILLLILKKPQVEISE